MSSSMNSAIADVIDNVDLVSDVFLPIFLVLVGIVFGLYVEHRREHNAATDARVNNARMDRLANQGVRYEALNRFYLPERLRSADLGLHAVSVSGY